MTSGLASRYSWIAVVVTLGPATFACGGTVDGDTVRTCSIPAGSYLESFAGMDGSSCPAIAAQTLTIRQDEISGQVVTTGGGFGLFDGGADCTASADSDTCTFTQTCSATLGGVATQTSIALTFSGKSANGQESTKSTSDSGTVESSCNYDITVTAL
jgi:hypothetical protein